MAYRAAYRYRPGGFVSSVASDQKFEEHLRRLAETRRMMMERKVSAEKQAAHPKV